MKILVLGSSGQIGAPLVKYLRQLNHKVYEFDIAFNALEDLRYANAIDTILSEVDFVFFLAFDIGGANYIRAYQNTYEFISNNMKIMSNTFDSLNKSNTPFIFASTQMSDMLDSTYGMLKRIGEKYTLNMNGKIIKMWNVYGHEKRSFRSHVITDFIDMAKKDNVIVMQTTGEEMRQFLYVVDCCKCLAIIMDKFNEIQKKELDVTSFKWMKIIDVAKIVASHFNGCHIQEGNLSDDVQRNILREPKEDILMYWKPETSIEQGIKNLIENAIL